MFVVAPIVCGGGRGVRFLFCTVALGALSSLAIVLLKTIELIALFNCVVAVCILCLDLFLAVPWVGLQSVKKV